MRFDSLAAFIQMDGHGPFIWAAYGITLVVLGLNVLVPWLARRNFIRGRQEPIDDTPAEEST